MLPNRTKLNFTVILVLIITLLVVVSALEESKVDVEEGLLREYCIDFQIWERTNGEFGAPDYENKAGEVCEPYYTDAPLELFIED